MRPRLRLFALLVGVALAAALVVLAPRVDDAGTVGDLDPAAAVGEAGRAGGEAIHRASGQAPERALLLLAVLTMAVIAAAAVGQAMAPRPGAAPSYPVLLARVGDRGPPAPTRSTVR